MNWFNLIFSSSLLGIGLAMDAFSVSLANGLNEPKMKLKKAFGIATLFFFMFIAFYGVGPGVCVWLALSELMPTRIRATGMSIAMIINQGVSALIATVFPTWVAATSFQSVFFCLAGFTVIYFIAAAFFLPETKGRTLEEIEKYFTTGKMPEKKQ